MLLGVRKGNRNKGSSRIRMPFVLLYSLTSFSCQWFSGPPAGREEEVGRVCVCVCEGLVWVSSKLLCN